MLAGTTGTTAQPHSPPPWRSHPPPHAAQPLSYSGPGKRPSSRRVSHFSTCKACTTSVPGCGPKRSAETATEIEHQRNMINATAKDAEERREAM